MRNYLWTALRFKIFPCRFAVVNFTPRKKRNYEKEKRFNK
jgi:hypothetical protein